MGKKAERIDPYTALIVQPEVTVVEDRAGIKKNLDRVCNMIHFGVGYFWEQPVRLVVLPEYFMQGVGTPGKGESTIKDQMDKVVTIPGPETDQLAAIAKEYELYIVAGGVCEEIPEFPDRWFNTNFIIGPDGDVVLKYHKWHIPAYIGLGTSPHDMFDEYCEKFGGDIKDLFPVIDTPIGKLGTMTCHDGCTPEVSRALGFNGVEVICHPGAIQEVEGVSEPWDFWMFTRRTRAHDNMCYLLGSNWGKVNYDYYPKAFCPGNSMPLITPAWYYDIRLIRRSRSWQWVSISRPCDIIAPRPYTIAGLMCAQKGSNKFTKIPFIRQTVFHQGNRHAVSRKKFPYVWKSSMIFTQEGSLPRQQVMPLTKYPAC